MRTLSARLGSEKGFSITELLVALVVVGIILAAIYSVWFGMQRTYAFTENDIKAQNEARSALAEIVELVRTSRQPDTVSSEDLRYVIVTADDNALTFWADEDRDASHDLELVRFRVDETTRTLYRDTSQTGDLTFDSSVRLVGDWLSNGTSYPLFSYFDAGGTELSTPVTDLLAIRTVGVNLRVDIDTGEAPITHELSSVIQPRNLRTY
ncbi:MAG: hypothetical protein A2133_11915 [Actinobacteria bacterium RBG_16_64_13]|nr:MAG: hypothetical protein A2133_11915 [Actinobacteria bacterium RBG_16_64_13]